MSRNPELVCPRRTAKREKKLQMDLGIASWFSGSLITNMHFVSASRMWIWLYLGLLATSNYAEGRRNGDEIRVGEMVRIHVFVEQDYYLSVVGCGQHQCGGVRLEGLDSMGMGFRTFVSNATDEPMRALWVLRQDFPFGTTFVPGGEFTIVVQRTADQEMRVWVEGKAERVADVKVEPGLVQLLIGYKHGTYAFSDEDKHAAKKQAKQQKCATLSPSAPRPPSLDSDNGDNDILEVTMGCRYRGENKRHSMCVVYLAVEGVKGREEIYRSKLARGEYDPELKEVVKLPFKFQEAQNLIFDVYQDYTDCATPSDAERLGTLQTPLATVNSKGKVELSLKEPSADEYSIQFNLNCEEKITLEFSGRYINGHGEVFLKILKSPPDNFGDKNFGFVEVAQTNEVPRDINFIRWEEMTLSVNALCDGDYHRPLKVYVLERTREGPKLIGRFDTSLYELKNPKNIFYLHEQEQIGEPHNVSGEIYAGEIPKNPTFSQYVAVGFELVGTVQIDFTASNDGPTPSLHHIGLKPNDYEVAIQGVGDIVEKFIADRLFKVYGFGADLPGQVGTSFDFSINLTSRSADCSGVAGVLKAYHESLQHLSLSGPTHFAPGIKKVVEMARQYEDGSKYFVHLLLTDGFLHDIPETKQAILEASQLPVSIIVIGIGTSEFLDLANVIQTSDEGNGTTVHWNQGQRGARDIVQFVMMKEFQDNDLDALKRSLRKRVLSKIPPQYLEYMKIRQIPPKPPRNSTITRVCDHD